MRGKQHGERAATMTDSEPRKARKRDAYLERVLNEQKALDERPMNRAKHADYYDYTGRVDPKDVAEEVAREARNEQVMEGHRVALRVEHEYQRRQVEKQTAWLAPVVMILFVIGAVFVIIRGDSSDMPGTDESSYYHNR